MELIDEGELDAATEKEFLTLMRQQVDRLTDLSLSLLDLSQVDSGAVRLEAGDTDITTLTRAVIAEFRPGAEGRDVTIKVTGPDELAAACDERRVTQVLRALLDNAVKFSPLGGTVTVGLTAERRAEGDDEDVVVTIADEGPGIPHDELRPGLRTVLPRQRRNPQVGHRAGPVDRQGHGRAHGGHTDRAFDARRRGDLHGPHAPHPGLRRALSTGAWAPVKNPNRGHDES